ncbi:hypothetical protein Tco_0879465 [Tanacetum coccineum]
MNTVAATPKCGMKRELRRVTGLSTQHSYYVAKKLRKHSEWQETGVILSEVAALITNDFGDGLPSKDIMVDSKDGVPKRISKLHPSYMALQYPLLFPYREDGFHEKIPYHSNR